MHDARAALDEALGPHRHLDGSLASLWTVEDVLHSVRRAPQLAVHLDWLPDYLATLVHRAFREMGARASRSGNVVRSTGPIDYEVDLDRVTEGLVNPPQRFPTFYCQYLTGLPLLGRATAPMWGVATAFMNHEWATTEHALIGTQRDRMDQAFPWVVGEHAARIPGADDDVRALISAMIWAPLGYPQNERGEHNRHRLQQRLGQLGRERASRATGLLLHHPDDALAMLAGWCAMALGREPTDFVEAHWMSTAVRFFRIVPVEPMRLAILALLPEVGDSAGGGDPETIAYLRELEREPAADVLPLVDDLVRQHDAAAYYTARGFTRERLGDDVGALNDHTAAIEQDPDFFLARINRGVLLARTGRHEQAIVDFGHALRISPYNVDARNNVVLATLFAMGTD